MQDYHSFLSFDEPGGLSPISLLKAPSQCILQRMILRPKPTANNARLLPNAPPVTEPLTPVPGWLRKAVADMQQPAAHNFARNSLEDVAIVTGAVIAALDLVVRRQEVSGGAWRQALALAAAAVTARQVGRVEDEGLLRDAVMLTRPGDDVGPAGRLLLAWRRLVTRPQSDLLSPKSVAAVLEEFGHLRNDETAGDLADALRQLTSTQGVVGSLTDAFAIADRSELPRCVGAWLADALLAQRLGWPHAVPLLGTEPLKKHPRGRHPRARVDGKETDEARVLLVAQARAALRAIDLSTEYQRRADRLLAVAPKLRAKGAGAVIEHLLSSDAVGASERIAGMSDRGVRRLFDRLLVLGAVRELSGRPTFRIYGL